MGRMRQSIRKYSWTPACDSQLENTPGQPRGTVNLNILLDTRVRQSIRKYSWTPACDSQLENTPGPPRATVNLEIILDIRVTVFFQRAIQPSAVLSYWKLEQDKCV